MFSSKFHCAMTCCVAINAKEGDCWIQLYNCLLSLMSQKCYINSQCLPSSDGQHSNFQCLSSLVGQHSDSQCLPSISGHHSLQIVFTKLTQVSKENLAENNVNRASMVNKGKLVLTRSTWSPKDIAKFVVVTKIHLVNRGNLFKTSVYQARSANEGF